MLCVAGANMIQAAEVAARTHKMRVLVKDADSQGNDLGGTFYVFIEGTNESALKPLIARAYNDVLHGTNKRYTGDDFIIEWPKKSSDNPPTIGGIRDYAFDPLKHEIVALRLFKSVPPDVDEKKS